ncbi:hypothetical protein IQ265_15200 [Nodosilinea sp. LEGE 06152]|uniref:hypothetical protein n=1 Tax=Nodosilinea sp. LEGE 06152 TaxID=2777966 RepID=UPI00188059E6|nr:hypothetical protein [Nodosilinea sp. LEGE 06152]MBE9158164.1 hypothetical protein [Nodosilinea sp. LEGE 06152]
MDSSPEALAALGRSLQHDLCTPLERLPWPAVAIAADDLQALTELGLEAQAIATFTADLTDLLSWLSEGLSLSGAPQPTPEPAGESRGAEPTGRSHPAYPDAAPPEWAPPEWAEPVAAAPPAAGPKRREAETGDRAVGTGNPGDGSLDGDSQTLPPQPSLEGETTRQVPAYPTLPQLTQSAPAVGVRALVEALPTATLPPSPAEFAPPPQTVAPPGLAENGQGLPKPRATGGLADLAKQLESSGWTGSEAVADDTQAPQTSAIAPTDPAHSAQPQLLPSDAGQPNPLISEVAPQPTRRDANQRPRSPEQVDPGTAATPASADWPQRSSALHPLALHPPSEELQALAAAISASPRDAGTAQQDRPRPAPPTLPWIAAPGADFLEAAASAEPQPEPSFPDLSPERSQQTTDITPLDRPLPPHPQDFFAPLPADPMPTAADSLPPSDAPDFEDLMSAIAHTINREYHRFYGP